MYSTDSRKFEEEVSESLDLDDANILARRIYSHQDYVRKTRGSQNRLLCHSRTQWTRVHDGVQEHFSSHVLINGSSYKLPSNVYALKQIAKQSWMLYKKRECERRKRLRVKLEKEREIETQGGPANILLSMVDACEVCKKLFVTVNLFWGITLCDMCYFNEEVIKDIMKQRKTYVNDDQNNPFRIAERVLARPSANERFFSLPVEEIEKPKEIFVPETPKTLETPFTPHVEEVIIQPSEPDERPLSSYIPLPLDSEEEFIHEEDSNGEDPLQFDGYFSQAPFLNEDFISD